MPDLLPRVLLVLGVIVCAVLAWYVLQRRSGQLRRGRGSAGGSTDGTRRSDAPSLRALESAIGSPVRVADVPTLVQFSSETCTPCRAAARTWRALGDSVTFVEVDVTEHERLVRDLGILRTPTALVFDRAGEHAGRITGAPTPIQAATTLSDLRSGGRS